MTKCDICGEYKVDVRHCTECCAQLNMQGKWVWPWSEFIPTDHEHKVFGGATV
jgi:ribosomal protein L32